jgi:hypothetical protein
MSSAKRRINSTGRKRVAQEAVDITLAKTCEGEPQKATAKMDLSSYQFPGNASVIIEAYRSSSLMRFDCGTIDNLQIPESMVLDEIDAEGNVQFRLKVVDHVTQAGKLLGVAARIRPRGADDDKGRRSLLPIRWNDLGPEVWAVSIDDQEPPALNLNTRATGLDAKILHDPLVRGIIMPAAFRIVLEKLVTLLPMEEDEDDDWKKDWLRFCTEELALEDPSDLGEEEKQEWVDDAVKEFASNAGFLEILRRVNEGGVQ